MCLELYFEQCYNHDNDVKLLIIFLTTLENLINIDVLLVLSSL